MLVNGNFSPQTNKKTVVFIFTTYQILAVSLTPVTHTFSTDFLSSYSLFTLLFSFPFIPRFFISFSFLLYSPKLWIVPTSTEENSYVSSMSPFSRDQMNESMAKTRAGKIIKQPLAQSAYLSLLIALMLFTSLLRCAHMHARTHTHTNSCTHMLILLAHKHIHCALVRIHMLIQTCLGCFLPLPRST